MSSTGDDRWRRGSTGMCPKCGSRKVGFDPAMTVKGYGPGIAACMNCRAIWEPFDPAQILDPAEPLAAFRDPCGNCAFRPGSPEQADRDGWQTLLASLRQGASFYCHKGVPIDADAEHGFAYPAARNKLRLCRGYLNAWPKLIERADRGQQDAGHHEEGGVLLGAAEPSIWNCGDE